MCDSKSGRPLQTQFKQLRGRITLASPAAKATIEGRRHFAIAAISVASLLWVTCESKASDPPISIGSRLELFVDNTIVDSTSGDVAPFVHEPKPGEVVLTTGEPWEGNTCAYYTIFRDGDIFRMYYRGSHYDVKTKKAAHPEFACYAESRDGLNWTKPKLGLFEFQGSKQNNIVWAGKFGTHNFTPFKDSNPKCKPDARYKALGGGFRRGLWAWESSDGIHWKMVSDQPVITKGAFDSQNLAFWDPNREVYVDFHRMFIDGRRTIMTCSSRDFRMWTDPIYLKFPDSPKEHLYTNAIRVYERAPHIYLGFPTRYHAASQQVEPILMASRDGLNFHRWPKAVVPRTAPKDRDGNRSNYMANALVQLPGNDREFAVYATEAYYTGPDSRIRQFLYRTDGFVSMRGGAKSGFVTTKTIQYSGSKLIVNYAAKKGGSVGIDLLSAEGEPLIGFTSEKHEPLTGDEIARSVTWKTRSIAKLSARPIRLRFNIRDADLFSFQFQK